MTHGGHLSIIAWGGSVGKSPKRPSRHPRQTNRSKGRQARRFRICCSLPWIRCRVRRARPQGKFPRRRTTTWQGLVSASPSLSPSWQLTDRNRRQGPSCAPAIHAAQHERAGRADAHARGLLVIIGQGSYDRINTITHHVLVNIIICSANYNYFTTLVNNFFI